MTSALIPLSATHELKHFLAQPEVTKIFASQDGPLVSVWTVVENFDREVRNRIYAGERALFRAFPNLKFDFLVLEDTGDIDLSDAELVYVR